MRHDPALHAAGRQRAAARRLQARLMPFSHVLSGTAIALGLAVLLANLARLLIGTHFG